MVPSPHALPRQTGAAPPRAALATRRRLLAAALVPAAGAGLAGCGLTSLGGGPAAGEGGDDAADQAGRLLYVADADIWCWAQGTASRLTRDRISRQPVWSPDGTRIAYTARSGGRHDVWGMAADGSNPQPVTWDGAARAPCWSPDGQALAFLSAAAGPFDLWAAPARRALSTTAT
jgi:dipeptidyl aminopeptidase/acylaminoacyl peptidase